MIFDDVDKRHRKTLQFRVNPSIVLRINAYKVVNGK